MMKYQETIEQSAEYLRLALPLMSRQAAALHPVSYGVWYEYVAGFNRPLRNAIDDLGIPVTAGGMPDRVKCLHVLVAHALAVGRGVNPLGDRAVDMLGDYVRGGAPCARLSPSA